MVRATRSGRVPGDLAVASAPGEAEAPIGPLAQEGSAALGIAGPVAPLAASAGALLSAVVLPAQGQRRAYGARKQHVVQRRAERAADQSRTSLERFEAVLTFLPTTGRSGVKLDLVQTTLAAMAANTVRGLLADMAGFGKACRRSGVSALPAQPASVIAFLKARAAGKGGLAKAKPAIRALKSDLEAFDLWCRRMKRIALPATPEIVADFLHGRARQGAKPASLSR